MVDPDVSENCPTVIAVLSDVVEHGLFAHFTGMKTFVEVLLCCEGLVASDIDNF